MLCASWAGTALADGGDGGGPDGGAGGTGFTGSNNGGDGNGTSGGGGGGAGGGDGGDGASNVNSGGPGGTAVSTDGQSGVPATGSSGGGGGGGGFNGNGAGAASINNAATLTGGNGGSGGANVSFSSGSAGGGGAGGYGAIVTGPGASSNSGTIGGGVGGRGGISTAGGGGGGDGGVGVQFTAGGANFTNTGMVTGGDGGDGGNGFPAGSGGTGGAGIVGAGLTIINSGAIRGGVGGDGGSGSPNGSPGAGGNGIVGAGLTIINSGTIMGGLSGDGTTRANAVTFTGGTNTLMLLPGFTIIGNAVGGAGTDTLAFGGRGSAAFNLSLIDTGGGTQQYQNFETFQVDSGTWSFSGVTTTAFTVNGGTLMGTGTFGGLTVNGGTVAPGNSIGTMTVNGAFTLGGGTVYEVEVNAAGQNDKVIVNGTVNLTGATLHVLAENGNYSPKTEYLIVDNDGSDAVVGQFATVTSNLAFLVPTVNYQGGTGNDVVLILSRAVGPDGIISFCHVAKTENQCNVANALDLFPTDNPLFLAVLNQTAAGARQAFDALSGEIHGTISGVLADDSRYVREAVLGRLMQATHSGGGTTQTAALAAAGAQVASIEANAMALGYDDKALGANMPAPGPGLAFWTRAFGAWGDFNGDGNAATADRDLGGFISGMDASLTGSWRVGLATGASFSNVDVDARFSSADVETYHLGGYLGGMAGAFALRGGGAYAWNDIETSRAVVFPGFFERQSADYDADTGQVFGEVAYPTQMGSIALEPFGGLAYVSIDTDTIRERGGALASLRGGADEDVGYSTLGLRAASTMHWGGMQVTPHVSAAWQHAFDDVTPDAALAFASTSIGFTVAGVPLAEDSVLIDAGVDLALGENTSAGVSYTGQFGDGVSDNGVKGRFTWLF